MKRDTKADLKILADAFFKELIFDDGCEYGSPGLDPKRPFGNSFVEGDILDLLEIEPDGEDWTQEQLDYAADLYRVKLVPYLKKFYHKLFRRGE